MLDVPQDLVGHFGCQGTPMTPVLLEHVKVCGEAVSFMGVVTAGKPATRTRYAAFLQVSIMIFFMFRNGWKGFVAIPTNTSLFPNPWNNRSETIS